MIAQSPRYKLHAFVCGPGCVRWRHDMGSVTLARIVVERPSDCRYAVVETADGRIEVIDIYALQFDMPSGTPANPTTGVASYATLDAAIMATALLYDQE